MYSTLHAAAGALGIRTAAPRNLEDDGISAPA
jgi:hypothetical protein